MLTRLLTFLKNDIKMCNQLLVKWYVYTEIKT